MYKNIIIKKNNDSTKITFKYNFLNQYINNLKSKYNKIFFIVDKKVESYLSSKNKNRENNFIYLNCSESIKNFKQYELICNKLFINKIDRASVIVCIGGGTLGDLSGYIASTILRGVKYILIPTTLLSQVDSSIGGKNGINTKFGKNLIGTFFQPDEILIDTKFLNTLSKREIKSGYSEILKHALIKDRNFFNWLDKNYINFFKLKKEFIEKAILKSILIKLKYVKSDTKENLTSSKSRAMLNFGHSIGHALETFNKYNKKINHGEAISIGLLTESYISNQMGYLSNKDYIKIKNHLSRTKLKIYDNNIKSKKLLNLLKKDKKNTNNQINLVLLKGIGSSFFCKNVPIKKIHKFIKNIY